AGVRSFGKQGRVAQAARKAEGATEATLHRRLYHVVPVCGLGRQGAGIRVARESGARTFPRTVLYQDRPADGPFALGPAIPESLEADRILRPQAPRRVSARHAEASLEACAALD